MWRANRVRDNRDEVNDLPRHKGLLLLLKPGDETIQSCQTAKQLIDHLSPFMGTEIW